MPSAEPLRLTSLKECLEGLLGSLEGLRSLLVTVLRPVSLIEFRWGYIRNTDDTHWLDDKFRAPLSCFSKAELDISLNFFIILNFPW